MIKFYVSILLLAFAGGLAAQCYMPQKLEDRMGESDMAVFGKVIASEPFYNEFGEIYTMHTLRVDRAATPTNALLVRSVQFFTMGGKINEEQLIVYPSLRGIRDAEGLFLLREYTGDRVRNGLLRTIYHPVAVHESFVGFNAETGRFTDGGTDVGDLRELQEFYTETTGAAFETFTGHNYEPIRRPRSMMPNVTSISPVNVNAGVNDIITISGNGFGSQRGDVFFDSPDDGPGGSFTSVPESAVLSWSDTQIRVRVISEAGSGSVIVRTAGGLQTTSIPEINIDYAITNLNVSNGTVVTPLLIDDEADGDGGYTFAVSNSSANGGRSLAGDAPALAALNRAVTSWQLDGDYNIRLEGTTAIQQPSRDDGVNIISYGSNAYDFDRELGSGTVGIAFSYYNACGSSEFEVSGLDILFRRPGDPNGFGGRVNYNFGPGFTGGADFESIALHEIGHTHQLKHVADPNEVMSFRITNGVTQRDVSPDTRAGARVVADLSLAYDPPIVRCGGDFNEERNYVTFSASPASVLPVTWTAFTAEALGKINRLAWSTSAEPNNEFFTIERSADGRVFTPLLRLDATGNATTGGQYEIADRQPLTGTSYYRVMQTDFDGTSTYSDVREVFRDAAGEWSVFPNPVVNRLNVSGGSAERYDVLDAAGRRLFTAPFGENRSSESIDVSQLRPGQYYLRAADGSVRSFVK